MNQLQADALLQLARALDVCSAAGLAITGTVKTVPLTASAIRGIVAPTPCIREFRQ